MVFSTIGCRFAGDTDMTIRLAQDTDVPELMRLYRETVLAIAPQAYTPAQTQAWAAFADETEAFQRFIQQAKTYVVEDESGMIGFAGLAPDGYVSAVYVRGDRIRQGIGSRLMQCLLDEAIHQHIPRLYAEASEFSLGLFQKFGFRHYETERCDRHGVQFSRYLVERVFEATAMG